MDLLELKRCSRCKQRKTLSDFNANRCNSDGKERYCKSCRKAYYSTEENKERARVRCREYYWRDPERHRERARETYLARGGKPLTAEQKAKKNEYSRTHVNPEIRRAVAMRRAARMQANGIFTITDRDMRRLKASPCFYCGSPDSHKLLDHVIPVSRGGVTSIGNLVPACKPACPDVQAKYTKTVTEWRVWTGFRPIYLGVKTNDDNDFREDRVRATV